MHKIYEDNRRVNGGVGEGLETDMYGGIWTNSISPDIELFNYMLQDHFGKTEEIPVYLTRKHVLDYIIGRVTIVNGDVFKNVKFDTEVT